MSLEIKKIFKIYSDLEKNKSIVSEALVKPSTKSYSNIKFADRAKNDDVNEVLLDDIQKAAEIANVTVEIGHIKTGHRKISKSGHISRHWNNNAVDIPIVNGKSVSPKNRADVDRFVNALVSLGYTKNKEINSEKAVLTFGFPDHDNHVHISNTTSSPSSVVDDQKDNIEFGDTTTEPSQTDKEVASDVYDTELVKLAGLVGKYIGLKESFGKNVTNRLGNVTIPGSSNSTIKSPVDGIVNNQRFVSGCKNQLTIETTNGFFLQYCGISQLLPFKNGEEISEGQILGNMDSNDVAEVLILNRSYYRQDIQPVEFEKKYKQQKKPKNKDTYRGYKKRDDERTYYDAASAALLLAPFSIFKDRYDKDTGKLTQKRWAETGEKQQVDPWILDLIKKPFKKKKKQQDEEKLQENIKRIKGLL